MRSLCRRAGGKEQEAKEVGVRSLCRRAGGKEKEVKETSKRTQELSKMPGPSRASRARLEKVVCRVVGCVDREGNQIAMNRSSYKEHLLLKHPSENSNDPRGFCSKVQLKLDFSKSKKTGSNMQQKGQQENENQEQEKQHKEQEKEHLGQEKEHEGREEEQGLQGQQGVEGQLELDSPLECEVLQ